MRFRRVLVLATVVALLAGLTSISSGETARKADDRTKNLRQLAQEPIEIGKDILASGSDLAFKGNLIAAGAYEGTGFFKITDARKGYVKQVGFHDCPGSQGDVSIYRNLLFVSIDSNTSNIGDTPLCNNTKTNISESSYEKEGIRIVDISNLKQPRQVGFVETDCGSHTHTLVPDRGKLYLYINSYPISGQGPTCNHATHRKFSIVNVNLKDPVKSNVINTHGLPPDTLGCHDTTIFPKKDLAIAACLGVWLTLDISNAAKPKTLAEVRNPEIELDHSSAITWDGKIALIGDEHAGAAGGGGCSPDSSSPVGAMWFYDISDPTSPELLASHSLPRVPVVDTPADAERFRCTTHNFNVVPMRNPKKYVVVSSYYSGGIAAIDFSDPENPKEIAHYVNEEESVNADTWSAYWYNGRIYTNDHGSKFGVGVYSLKGTGRAQTRYFKGGMNPQLQVARFR
jgi:hypothetical protein